MIRLLTMFTIAAVAAGSPALGQVASDSPADRPATASFWGDTGLWFVPTAEVVRPRGWSFSLYRTEFDFKQGATDVSDWPLTFAVGAGPRAEVFAAMRVVTRIDRDLRPLFEPANENDGGLVNDRPFVRETWTGNDPGDLFLGTKINLVSERLNQPFALAVRGTVKLPTADEESGAGTGQTDYFADVVMSREIGRRVELTAFGGYAFRGDPDDIDVSNGLRWGFGAAFGARANVRFTAEMFGERTSENVVRALPGVLTGADGSIAPGVSHVSSGTTAALGLTWQHGSGMLLGAGITYQFGLDGNTIADPRLTDDDAGHAVGLQFRIGFHRGVQLYRPPAPPPIAAAPEPAPVAPPVETPPPAAAPAPVNQAPMVRASCDPCRVVVGQAVTIRVEGTDPDGDPLTYRWSSSAGGTLIDPRAATTTWRAETVPGTVTMTVTADDGRGNVVSDRVSIEIISLPVVVAFDDVLFDLDAHALRPDALAVLERAVTALRENPSVRLHIEGHASEEGTASYNMALSERRAQAVRDFLLSHGIEASRLRTTGFGETRPKYDNAHEETRRLNRRAALAVEGQSTEVR